MAATTEINSGVDVKQTAGSHLVQRSSSDNSEEGGLPELHSEKPTIVDEKHGISSDDISSDSAENVFEVKDYDPVLAKKMALVNKAIDEIGMTSFQWKMFYLNGFGYAVDSVSNNIRRFGYMI